MFVGVSFFMLFLLMGISLVFGFWLGFKFARWWDGWIG